MTEAVDVAIKIMRVVERDRTLQETCAFLSGHIEDVKRVLRGVAVDEQTIEPITTTLEKLALEVEKSSKKTLCRLLCASHRLSRIQELDRKVEKLLGVLHTQQNSQIFQAIIRPRKSQKRTSAAKLLLRWSYSSKARRRVLEQLKDEDTVDIAVAAYLKFVDMRQSADLNESTLIATNEHRKFFAKHAGKIVASLKEFIHLNANTLALCFRALALTFNTKENQDIGINSCMEAGIASWVISCMSDNDTSLSLRVNGCFLIKKLTEQSVERKYAKDFLRVLTNAMKEFPEDRNVQCHGIGALAQITGSPTLVKHDPSIVACVVLGAMKQFSTNEDIQHLGAVVITNIVRQCTYEKKREFAEVVLTALRESHLQDAANGLISYFRALQNLTANDNCTKQTLHDKGIGGLIKSVMIRHQTRVDLQAAACGLLAHLFSLDDFTETHFEDLVPLIVSHMQTPTIHREAVFALFRLSSRLSYAEKLESLGAVDVLVQELHRDPEPTQVVNTLYNLSLDRTVKKVIYEKGVREWVQQYIDSSNTRESLRVAAKDLSGILNSWFPF